MPLNLQKPLTRFNGSILHSLGFAVVLILGTALRFWQLDAKPLWLDEVLTAIFGMGHRYSDMPVQTMVPLDALERLFTVQPGVSCSQIAQTVATESVHPPLFFCLTYGWMTGLHPDATHWVWALRSLPALLGVGAIAAIYYLNRIAFSPATGLFTAALMAVSPFAVYLSQEARHYTLPMLLITLALIGLVQMQQDLHSHQPLRPAVWLGWAVANSIGLYTHYFCLLALIAQVVALVGWMMQQRHWVIRHWAAVGLAIAGIGFSYLPWLGTLLAHVSRPETDWLTPYNPDWADRIAPLYQTLIGWVLMVIALPVERQPRAIAIGSAIMMLLFSIWLVWQVIRGATQRWQWLSDRPPLVLLAGFTGCVLLQFAAIVYILDKDITAVPRYNFVYYPGVCALLGACLVRRMTNEGKMMKVESERLPHPPPPSSVLRPPSSVLLVGVLSSLVVGYGLAFQKSYNPDRVVKNLYFEPAVPMIVATSYQSLQEIALGLSFVLELRTRYPAAIAPPVQVVFLDRRDGTNATWRTLERLPQPLPLPLNLWVVAPEIRKRDYPDRLGVSNPANTQTKATCVIDPEEFHRLGFPYQLYRCNP